MLPEPTRGACAPICYQIRVLYPNGRVLELESRRRLLYVGRTQGNDLRLAHPFVSARHLVLRVVDDQFRITDLGSTTGTKIAGTLLVPLVEQALEDGDLVEVGPLKLTFDRVVEARVEYEPGGRLPTWPRLVPAAAFPEALSSPPAVQGAPGRSWRPLLLAAGAALAVTALTALAAALVP